MDLTYFDRMAGFLPDLCFERPPDVAIVLGSGWANALSADHTLVRIPYADIPGLGAATVAGHTGEFWLYERAGRRVVAFCGRRHWYEGCEWEQVVMPAVLARRLGAPVFLVTNAAGGIRPTLRPGDVVVIRDHLRLSPLTPLRGPHDPAFGPRFPDQSRVYDADLAALLHAAGERQGIELADGVYVLSCGPAFETPAEIRAYGILGADVVGMSTVPEAMVASACGLRVAGLSFVSNMAAGVTGQLLDGNDVVDCAAHHSERLARLVLDFLDLAAPAP